MLGPGTPEPKGNPMKLDWPGAIAAVTIALAALAAAPASRAQHPVNAVVDSICEREYQALPYGTILDLLDPAARPELRAAALEAWQRLATIHECPEFAYTLGQLYRHGPDLPGNPLPQDVPRARELIRPMAEQAGYLNAFADLAEMEMRHANARETMMWTQVYLYLVQQVRMEDADPDERHYQRSAYNGHLLARAELIWRWARPVLRRKVKEDDFNAYLAAHPDIVERVRAYEQGRVHRRSSAQNPGVRVAHDPGACWVSDLDRLGSASAAWIVEVLPSGAKGRIVLENFVPNARVTEELKACLLRLEFAPFGGTTPVTFRYSAVMGSGEGASIRRPRRR